MSSSPDAFWTAVFSKYYLSQSELDAEGRDDLLFFVRTSCNGPVARHHGSSNNLTTMVLLSCIHTSRSVVDLVPSCYPYHYLKPSFDCYFVIPRMKVSMYLGKIPGIYRVLEILCTIGKRLFI